MTTLLEVITKGYIREHVRLRFPQPNMIRYPAKLCEHTSNLGFMHTLVHNHIHDLELHIQLCKSLTQVPIWHDCGSHPNIRIDTQ